MTITAEHPPKDVTKKTKPPPWIPRRPALVLELGQILNQRASHRTKGDDEKLKKAEERFRNYLSKSANSDKIIDVVGSGPGRKPDMLEARVLSVVAFLCTMTDYTPQVRWVSEVVGGTDLQSVMSSRIALFRLIKRGVIGFKNGSPWTWNGTLYLKKATLEWMGLLGPGTPVLYNSEVLTAHGAVTATSGFGVGDDGVQAGTSDTIPTVQELTQSIGQHFFGYEQLVQSIAARTVMHLHRANLVRHQHVDPQTPAEVFLVLGHSGVGKTHLVRTLAQVTGRCYTINDATTITCEGYVGLGPSKPLADLYANAGDDRRRAEDGSIICLDEWDKKSSTFNNGNLDVFGHSVQASFLTQIESREPVSIGGRRNNDRQERLIDVRALMWMFMGAFSGLDLILEQHTGDGMIGFSTGTQSSRQRQYLLDALQEYGMLPEFLNRLTGLYRLPDPDLDTLVTILSSEGGILSSYNTQLKPLGSSLRLTDGASHQLACYALETKTFARGLKAGISRICEGLVITGDKGESRIDAGEMGRIITGMNEL